MELSAPTPREQQTRRRLGDPRAVRGLEHGLRDRDGAAPARRGLGDRLARSPDDDAAERVALRRREALASRERRLQVVREPRVAFFEAVAEPEGAPSIAAARAPFSAAAAAASERERS